MLKSISKILATKISKIFTKILNQVRVFRDEKSTGGVFETIGPTGLPGFLLQVTGPGIHFFNIFPKK